MIFWFCDLTKCSYENEQNAIVKSICFLIAFNSKATERYIHHHFVFAFQADVAKRRARSKSCGAWWYSWQVYCVSTRHLQVQQCLTAWSLQTSRWRSAKMTLTSESPSSMTSWQVLDTFGDANLGKIEQFQKRLPVVASVCNSSKHLPGQFVEPLSL